jgi:hypothetical protein
MILQVLSDCTLNVNGDFRLYGPGELLTLPAYLAVRVVNLEPQHFKIMKPTPLIPGVAVRWLSPDDTAQGPGAVQLADGEWLNRRILVLIDGELRWIHERDITEVDPWPAIDAKLEEAVDHLILEGEASPKLVPIQEWLIANFEEDGDPTIR